MNASELHVAAALPARSATVPHRLAGPAATVRCLVVTANSVHATLLESSAGEEGWSVDVAATADEAIRLAFRFKFGLAVVDLQSVVGQESLADFEQLARDLVGNHVPLLVINGDPADPLGEFVARQMGVWVYLPGLGDESGLECMFRNAREATKKLAQSSEANKEQAAKRQDE